MSQWQTAGKVRMTPRGTWDSTTAYNVLDLVSNPEESAFYIAKSAVPAGTVLTNTTYWSCVVNTDALGSMVAPTFENLIFPILKGQYCIYNNTLYVANQKIQDSGAWNSSQWDATTIEEEIEKINSNISIIESNADKVNENVYELSKLSNEAFCTKKAYGFPAVSILDGARNASITNIDLSNVDISEIEPITQVGENILKDILNVSGTDTYDGLTYVTTNDCSITISGTASKNSYYTIVRSIPIKAGDYLFSGGISNAIRIMIRSGDITGTEIARSNGSGSVEFSINADTTIGINLMVSSGETCNNVVVLPEIKELITYTNSVIITRTGKNILKNTTDTGSIVRNGLTYVTSNDGSIAVTGTATNNTYYTVVESMSIKAGNYLVSGGLGGSIRLSIRSNNSSGTEIVRNAGGITSLSIENDTSIGVVLVIANGTVCSSSTIIYPMIRFVGYGDNNYECANVQTHIIPLTATEDDFSNIKTLYGINHIWSNIGKINVEYCVDSTILYNNSNSDINNRIISSTVNNHTIRKPRVTFIDDDGRIEFYNLLLPLIKKYNIPITSAYMADIEGWRDTDYYMSVDQLKEVEAAGGEIITHTGGNLTEETIEEAEARSLLSKNNLLKYGFSGAEYFIYPRSASNEEVRAMVTKHFKCAFVGMTDLPDQSGLKTNMGCIGNYFINRSHCGGSSYDPVRTYGRYANMDTSSMDYFEYLVQEAIDNNSWLVLYTHSFQMEEGPAPYVPDGEDAVTQVERMEEIIEYILELKDNGIDIDIITVKDGFEMFGNAIQFGDYLGPWNNDLTIHSNPGSAVNKLGECDFPYINNSIKNLSDSVSNAINNTKNIALNAYPVDDVSGAIVELSDGAANIPVKSLIVQIKQSQSGDGDPDIDNVRNISGYNKAEIHVGGANLYDSSKNVRGSFGSEGTVIESESATTEITDYIQVDGIFTVRGHIYTSQGSYPRETVMACIYDEDKVFVREYGIYYRSDGDGSFSLPLYEDEKYVRYTITARNIDNTNYKMYSDGIYEIDWSNEAGTVYGGTLDVLSGVLTIDRIMDTLDGSETWNTSGSNSAGFICGCATSQTKKSTNSNNADVKSNRFSIVTNTSVNNPGATETGISSGGGDANHIYFFLRYDFMENVQSWKEWLTENNVQVSYLLLVPITVQLTAIEVCTLLGTNTISVNCGDISIAYRADTSLYVQRQINSISEQL